MQNDGIGYADKFESCPKGIPQFCILHFEFCIYIIFSSFAITSLKYWGSSAKTITGRPSLG